MRAISLTLLVGALLLLFWYRSAKKEFKKIKERNLLAEQSLKKGEIGKQAEIPAKEMTVEGAREQAEISANDVIRQLQESIEHQEMSYPELIEILRFYLKKSIVEMQIFRPDNLSFSLKEVGLNKIFRALTELERKETQKKGKNTDHC